MSRRVVVIWFSFASKVAEANLVQLLMYTSDCKRFHVIDEYQVDVSGV